MNTLTRAVLKNSYETDTLYSIVVIGFGNDSDNIRNLTMSNTAANADKSRTAMGGDWLNKAVFHSIDLFNFAKALNGNKEIVRHYQNMYFKVGDDEFYSKQFEALKDIQSVFYSHSNSVCQTWIKSAKMYDNTFTNLGISAWGGSGTKPSDFLNNKGIASMGIHKLMTGTI
jgi:hypothetical protein